MAQIDYLTTALTNDQTGLGALVTDAGELVTVLKKIQTQGGGGPDLSQAIAMATALGTGIAATDAAVKAALLPVVSAVAPNSGPVAGGTPVVITGTGLSGATAVMFGTVAAPTLGITSDESLAVTAPPGASAGPVDVTVVTPLGTSAVVPADVFTYV